MKINENTEFEYNEKLIIRKNGKERHIDDSEASTLITFIKGKLKKKEKDAVPNSDKERIKKECMDLLNTDTSALFE